MSYFFPSENRGFAEPKPNPVLTSAWSAWSDFSDCSTTCGPGSKIRQRTCENGSGKEISGCDGESEETAQCNIKACSGTSL